jgi:hypothetical protein
MLTNMMRGVLIALALLVLLASGVVLGWEAHIWWLHYNEPRAR